MSYQIDELKNLIKNTPLSRIIGEYIPLQKKGINYEGICPFHNDTKPSLKVNDSKGIYKCFACEAAGDAITFVQEHKRLSFIDTITEIAELIGVSAHEIQVNSQKNSKKSPLREMAEKVLKTANHIYLKSAQKDGIGHYEYFLEHRKISVDTAQKFQIGYAPKNNVLTNYLLNLPDETKSAAIKAALEIGMIKPSQKSEGYYDTFRHRIMFPTWDHYGQLCGFSSRAIEDEQVPKYLNSKESFIYNKRMILFGFHFAKDHVRDKDFALITEGHMDTIALHQHGFPQTVATMGVAISENPIKQMKRFSENIILALDNDDAGRKAAQRMLALFLKEKLNPRTVDLSPHKDPDEFLVHSGRMEMQKRIDSAPFLLDTLIDKYINNDFGANTSLKLKALQNIFDLVAPLQMDLLATEKVTQAAKDLGLTSSSDIIVKEYREYLAQNHFASRNKATNKNLSFRHVTREESQSTQAQDLPQETVDQEAIKQEAMNEQTHGLQANAKQEEDDETKPLSKMLKKFIILVFQIPEVTQSKDFTEILDFVNNRRLTQFLAKMKLAYEEVGEQHLVSTAIEQLEVIPLDEVIKKELFHLLSDLTFSQEKERQISYQDSGDHEKVGKIIRDVKYRLMAETLKEKRMLLKQKQKELKTEDEIKELLTLIHNMDKELFDLKTSKSYK